MFNIGVIGLPIGVILGLYKGYIRILGDIGVIWR